jgi:group I intron endonuclease
MIVYKTTNLVNGKIYVGQSLNGENWYLGSGTMLKRAIRKYGKDLFLRETLRECTTKEELDQAEREWIAKLNAQDPKVGYNIAFGGAVDLPKSVIDRRIESIRKWNREHPSPKKGIRIRETTKAKIKENNSRYWKGRHHSEETKEKLRVKRAAQDMTHKWTAIEMTSPAGELIVFSSLREMFEVTGMTRGSLDRMRSGAMKKTRSGWALAKPEGEQNEEDEVFHHQELA